MISKTILAFLTSWIVENTEFSKKIEAGGNSILGFLTSGNSQFACQTRFWIYLLLILPTQYFVNFLFTLSVEESMTKLI